MVYEFAQAKTPNPVTLRLYRTFNEVEQPASQFVFRVNKLANLALFLKQMVANEIRSCQKHRKHLKMNLLATKNYLFLA